MFEGYKQRKREQAYQAALAVWQREADELDGLLELAGSGGFSAADAADASGVVLDADEVCFGVFTGVVLVEPRVGAGHWEGRSQGVSIPIYAGVRYRVGATKGTYVKGAEAPTPIDTGTAVVTNRRMLFIGPNQQREWLWAKTTAVMDSDEAPMTSVAVSNRQKVSGIAYDSAHAVDIRFRIDLAVATAKGTVAALVEGLRADRAALEARQPLPEVPAVRELPSARAVMALPASDELGGPPALPAPGWYPDTYKRYELRYWDGEQWTDHVATGGVQAVDPVG